MSAAGIPVNSPIIRVAPYASAPEVVIGLVGRKKAGKDTVFALARDDLARYYIGAQRFAFGDLLKAELAAALGVSVDFINANKDNFRGGLQWYGTEYRRGLCGADYWVRQLEQSRGWQERDRLLVKWITDVRFANEAAWVRSQGGLLVRVERSAADQARDNHGSESELARIQCEYTISNDSSLDLLRAILRLLVPELLARSWRKARRASVEK